LHFAHILGLVYQMIDDYLDQAGDDQILGKPLQQDQKNSVKTFMDFYSPQALKEEAESLIQKALAQIPVRLNPDHLWTHMGNYVLKRGF
jgi:geranylgeranyl diphosphate synthase type II